MSKLIGKTIEATSKSVLGNERCIGQRLRDLRILAGLTQVELAERLNIGQTALSRLEKRRDVQFSTLRDYVEALGAKLRITAAFDLTTATALNLVENVCDAGVDEDQFVLPIFSDEDYQSGRDVVLSIKPQYSSLIMEGRKTVELRRRFPIKVPKGTLAFIYSTTPDQAIVGTARIKGVVKEEVSKIWADFAESACVEKDDFDAYFAGVEEGFALRFENVRSFQRAVGLQELRDRFSFEPPQSFLYAKPVLREALNDERSKVPH